MGPCHERKKIKENDKHNLKKNDWNSGREYIMWRIEGLTKKKVQTNSAMDTADG